VLIAQAVLLLEREQTDGRQTDTLTDATNHLTHAEMQAGKHVSFSTVHCSLFV